MCSCCHDTVRTAAGGFYATTGVLCWEPAQCGGAVLILMILMRPPHDGGGCTWLSLPDDMMALVCSVSRTMHA